MPAGARSTAALRVAAYHLTYLAWADPYDHGLPDAAAFRAYAAWRPCVGTGWVGIRIVFAISGFVIAYTAHGRSPARFVPSRMLRLLPTIRVCATISLAIALWHGTPSARATPPLSPR